MTLEHVFNSLPLIMLYIDLSNNLSGVSACEHRPINIECPPGEVISIRRATYGRSNRRMCRYDHAAQDTGCNFPGGEHYL